MIRREQLERLFVENLTSIDRSIRVLCRRYGVASDEAEDVASWVKCRLIENDYAAFEKFRGESTISTYLSVVVAMLFRDYRAEKWGRWRPSAAALRRGAVTVRLEALVLRDRMPLRQAAELLRSSGHTDLSDAALGRMLGELPARDPLRPVETGPGALPALPDHCRADAGVLAEAHDRARRDLAAKLEAAVRQLPPEDQVVLRLRYWEAMSIADIARLMSLPQKPLYRRMDGALRSLRESLSRSGVALTDIVELLDSEIEAEVA